MIIERILYECDRKACGELCPNEMCHLTAKVSHAVNFKRVDVDDTRAIFIEGDGEE